MIQLQSLRGTEALQNLAYTYDPVGNITHIQDQAQQTIYFRNQIVEPSNNYTYDAIYRLISATGREHLGQTGERANAPTAPDAFNEFHTNLDHPGNGNAMGTYSKRYLYDAVGNILSMQHRGSNPANPGWTRNYAYNETSLIEPSKQSNRLSNTRLTGNSPVVSPYLHDAHGNMIRMPHLANHSDTTAANMHWDYNDQLQQADLGGGGTAYYVYDAAGQRIRKIVEKSPGLTEERIYLGGFEVFRKRNGTGTITLERETLHVMDDQQRIALVETRTIDTANTDRAPAQLIRYQLGNHLGSGSVELDQGGQVISYEEYYPYGSTSYQAVRSGVEVRPKRYRYTGMERDEETGLNYHGARYYAPWLGRWCNCDPGGLKDGLNIFAYAKNNPIKFVDLNGNRTTVSQRSTISLDELVNILNRHFPSSELSERTGYVYPERIFSSSQGRLEMADPTRRSGVFPDPLPEFIGSLSEAIRNQTYEWEINAGTLQIEVYHDNRYVITPYYNSPDEPVERVGQVGQPPIEVTLPRRRVITGRDLTFNDLGAGFILPTREMVQSRGAMPPSQGGIELYLPSSRLSPDRRGMIWVASQIRIIHYNEAGERVFQEEVKVPEETIAELVFHELSVHAGSFSTHPQAWMHHESETRTETIQRGLYEYGLESGFSDLETRVRDQIRGRRIWLEEQQSYEQMRPRREILEYLRSNPSP